MNAAILRNRRSRLLTAMLFAWMACCPARAETEILVKFKEGAGDRPVHPRGAVFKREFKQIGWQSVTVLPHTTPQELLARYRERDDVEFAELSRPVQKLAKPSDPRFGEMWGLEKIGAPAAWDTTTGSASVVVAVVDTGIDFSHPDLAPNAWRNPGEIPGNFIDDDNNGFVDDVHGIDAVEGDSDIFDDDGHGSHVAGTIGAAGNNGVGVTGVNWNVSLMGLRIGRADGFGTTEDIAAAYNYAIAMKAKGVNLRVINNSWGNDYPSRAIYDAFCKASDAGILSVCAAGNDGVDNDLYPHFPSGFDCPGLISVAASDQDDKPATFSNYGRQTVHLAAPGLAILSTLKGGPFYVEFQGTSMASPHVAGAAALLLSKRPDLTMAQLKSVLIDTVDRLPAWEGKVVSGGRLNLAKAMGRVMSSVPIPQQPVTQPAPPVHSAKPLGPRILPVSRAKSGRFGSHGSFVPSISADGRWVVFASRATNLTDQAGNNADQIFLHDRQTAAIIRVSSTPDGLPGNAASSYPSVSGDGRFVVFESQATNLVPDDGNRGFSDIFLYERETGALSLISRSDPSSPADAPSGLAVISADGRWIAYVSAADNLTGDDFGFEYDVFLHDRLGLERLRRVSASSLGLVGDGESLYPTISADGRYVAFSSVGQLLAEDRNNREDVYLFDRTTETLERISVTSTGTGGNGNSSFPTISGDGRFVAFVTSAPNLTGSALGIDQIVLRDRVQRTTRLISKNLVGSASEADSFLPALSANGRYLAFSTDARDLARHSDSVFIQLYLYDTLTLKLARASHAEAGEQSGENCLYPSLSADGRWLAFASSGFNLVPTDGNAASDIFVLDRGISRPDLSVSPIATEALEGAGLVHPGVAQRAEIRPLSSSGPSNIFLIYLENAGENAESFQVRCSPLSRGWSRTLLSPTFGVVVAPGETSKIWKTPLLKPGEKLELRLLIDETSGAKANAAECLVDALDMDGVLRDRVRTVTLPPFSPPGAVAISRQLDGKPGEHTSRGASISADGRRIAFQSDTATFANGDDNFDTDVFLWDAVSGQIELVSASSASILGNARSDSPSISADGRRVAFTSRATNLITSDRNNKSDVFVKDLATRLVRRVSIASGGREGSRGSEGGVISADGNVVAFQSLAPDLVANDFNQCWDIFTHDLRTGTTRCLSLNPDKKTANADSTDPQISGDGRWVAFVSRASELVLNDANDEPDVFLADTMEGTIELVSRRADGGSPKGSSSLVSMSSDGRFILFDSNASDLAGQTGADSLFLYDRVARKIEPVAPSIPGFTGSPRFASGALSPDGRWIALNSATPGLVPGDTNDVVDAFLYDRQTGGFECISLVPGGVPSNGASVGARFSEDGRFVTFRSLSSTLLGEGESGVSQVFRYDRARFQPALSVRLPDRQDPVVLGSSIRTRVDLASPVTGTVRIPLTLKNAGSQPDQFSFHILGAMGGIVRSESGEALLSTENLRDRWFEIVPVSGTTNFILEVPAPASDSNTSVDFWIHSSNDPSKSIRLEVVLLADSDGDGLADAWERDAFGNLAASNGLGDSDGDGVSDAMEFAAATQPRDANSRLELFLPKPLASGGVRLSWSSVAGRTYVIEKASGDPVAFKPMSDPIGATPPFNEFDDFLESEKGAVFYRVRLLF